MGFIPKVDIMTSMDSKTYNSRHMGRQGAHIMGPRDALILAALGLAGECAEVRAVVRAADQGGSRDPAALADELGDVLWYATLGCQALGVDFRSGNDSPGGQASLSAEIDDLRQGAGHFADMVKKVAYHGKPLDLPALAAVLAGIFRSLAGAADCIGQTMGELRAANDAKLTARWPDGFRREDEL